MARRLIVLNVAYPLAPVGPDAVGGAEQVLSRLDVALTCAGHRSIVVACEGSAVSGTLVATRRPEGELTENRRRAAQEHHRAAIEEVLRREPVDVVHLHGIDFAAYLPRPGVPVLATLHLPPDWYPPEVFRPARSRTYLNCVSEAQRRTCPTGSTSLPVIENGVPHELFATWHAKRRFALALGRICPEKGFHMALDASARADIPLLLGGEVFRYEAHERYFRDEIVPRLGDGRRFLGPVGFERKQRLLSAARCLLVPSLAPETSSLVAMEALACGTPVIAYPSGALAEIVEHGRTGFLVRDECKMADAIASVDLIDPDACRASARGRFSAERMTRQYLELYATLAAGDDPSPTAMKREVECVR
jgi:glycosyltransferase involved in cell wall biosynthesis